MSQEQRKGAQILDEIRREIDARPKTDRSNETPGPIMWAEAGCPVPARRPSDDDHGAEVWLDPNGQAVDVYDMIPAAESSPEDNEQVAAITVWGMVRSGFAKFFNNPQAQIEAGNVGKFI